MTAPDAVGVAPPGRMGADGRVPRDLDRAVRGRAGYPRGIRPPEGPRVPDRREDAITQIFDRAEIESYLDTVHRVGALGHVSSDEAYEEMREAGAIDEDPVEWAEDILLIERAKELLLG